jgi:DNA-binding response OmpR family regulator
MRNVQEISGVPSKMLDSSSQVRLGSMPDQEQLKPVAVFVMVVDGSAGREQVKETLARWQMASGNETILVDLPEKSKERMQELETRNEVAGFGDVKVNFSEMVVKQSGHEVRLTGMEFKTLKYLMENPRRVISRDELLHQVWGYENYPCTRTVDNHIFQLRQKLEREPSRPSHFHTVHGSGYKFVP